VLARFRRAPFPLYGLPASWVGMRYLEGAMTAWSRGRSEAVVAARLGHGDPVARAGAWLVVTVTSIDPEVGRTLATIRRRLVQELHGVADRAAEPAGTSVTLTVDGQPTGFEWYAAGRHWAAVAEVGSAVVSLRSRDLPVAEVELVRVTDLGPYLAGQRQLRAPDLK
jgi:hypothetical protein